MFKVNPNSPIYEFYYSEIKKLEGKIKDNKELDNIINTEKNLKEEIEKLEIYLKTLNENLKKKYKIIPYIKKLNIHDLEDKIESKGQKRVDNVGKYLKLKSSLDYDFDSIFEQWKLSANSENQTSTIVYQSKLSQI
ncbi:hypothetical protein [Spiroplasma endosymbiont of Aleiodes alternator]|uniref:hypothetical protein n=1 Tax=Spiroplasma endosymbiont of Aleiodes alternator TaxID=3139329 RepID=UPI003CCA71AE